MLVRFDVGLAILLHPPPHCEPTLVDSGLPVGTDDAKDMAGRLAREVAPFAGTSSGAKRRRRDSSAPIQIRAWARCKGGHADGRL